MESIALCFNQEWDKDPVAFYTQKLMPKKATYRCGYNRYDIM